MYGFVDTVPGSGTGSTSLMSIRTIFNGIDLDQELTDETGSFTTLTVNGRNDTRSTINSFSVPGMDGAHEEGNTLDAKTINVRFRITDKTNEGFRERLNRLNALLSGSKQVLEFTDEDAVFYATVSSVEMPDEESNDLIGNIFFYCSDPYKYGPELEATFPSDAVTVTNNGTAPAKPVFELEVNESTTFAMVSNGDEYMMIGKPVDVDSVEYSRLTTILNDNCSSLVGWTALPNGTQLDTGIVGGQMMVRDGYAFQAQSYGTNPNGWVGPAIRRSLSEPVQDFRAEIRIGAFNEHGDVGSLELHLMDAQDNVVAIMAMRDSSARTAENRAVIQLGQAGNRHQFVNYNGGYRSTWNNFSGIIRLEREGNEFRAHVAVIEADGRHNRRYTSPVFIDTLGDYQAPIAQILVYDAKAKEYSTYDKLMNNIYIGRINQDIGIPYIAHEGDVITFDHEQSLVLINGEPRKDLKNFGADYFKLQPGVNNLVVAPEETFNTTLRYREAYK